MTQSSIRTVGFIGIGVMGRGMASNLLKAGYSLRVFTRRKETAKKPLESGAVWCDSPAQTAQGSDAVITMVGFPADVKEIYLGPSGLIEAAAPGTLLVDMTTSSPTLAAQIAHDGAQRGLFCLDAPVSGGDTGAAKGTLSIMVGGTEEAFEKARALLSAMGTEVHRQGGAGMGQHTKMVNQILIASGMVAVSEALCYAKAAGLDPESVMASVSKGAAASWTLDNRWPQMLSGNYKPGFYVKHFIKDMGIALQSAREMNLQLPGLELADKLYRQLAEDGGENDGTQALFKLYDRYLVARRLKS